MTKAVLFNEKKVFHWGLASSSRDTALSPCWGAGSKHGLKWRESHILIQRQRGEGGRLEHGLLKPQAHPRDTLPTSTALRPHLLILSHILLAGLSIQIYEPVGAFLIQTTLWYYRYPSFFPKVGLFIAMPPISTELIEFSQSLSGVQVSSTVVGCLLPTHLSDKAPHTPLSAVGLRVPKSE